MKTCILLLLMTPITFAQINNGISGSGGQGPVFNVQSYGASSTLTDNATAFTAAFAASNAYSSTSIPGDTHTAPSIGVALPAASVTIAASAYPGDTTYYLIVDSLGQAMTINDTLNTFTQISAPTQVVGCCWIQIYRTTAGATKAFSSITVSTSPAEDFNVSVISLPAVAGQNIGTIASGSGTSISNSVTTTAANSMVLSVCGWYSGGSTSNFTSTAGRSKTNQSASGGAGEATWGTSSASIGSVTNSGTISVSGTWGCRGIEVLAGGTSIGQPTVYIPEGMYFYSGGINPTVPSMLKCEPGTFLDYIGNGHAADIGPVGGFPLGTSSGGQSYLAPAYIIDGCTFIGGNDMTEGIVMQPMITEIGIRNSNFINFGNSTSYMIYGTCSNWDVEIGPQNRFLLDDLHPRNILLMNSSACDFNSFVRIHDNNAFCMAGVGQSEFGPSCTAGQAGIGFVVDSLHSRVYHNNIAFFNPDIWMRCTQQPCSGNNIESNQLEVPQTAGTGTILPPIQFSTGNDQLLVINNSVWMHNSGVAFIGPRTGTDLLTGSRINWNQVGQLPATNPLVALNNLANQTGNQSYGNGCSTGLSPHIACPLIHTTGASIARWNADYYIPLTFSAATAVSYTFGTTYTTAPICVITSVSPGTTTFSITTLSTTTLTVTASVAFTGTVGAHCSASDGQ